MADVPDPYGIDLALSQTGDLMVSTNGDVATIDGPDNCVQALTNRVRTNLGELPLQPDYGSGMAQLVGKKYDEGLLRGQATSELDRLVTQDRRFLQAQDLVVRSVDGLVTGAQIAVTLQLAGGEVLGLTDLSAPRIDEVQPPDDADLADLAQVDEFDDFEFLTQDDAELTDLQDQADLNATITPDVEVD